MDWDAAIGKNREALKRILAMLVAMAGLELEELRGRFTFFRQKGTAASRSARAEKSKLSPAFTPALDPALALPRHLHRAILRLLRPAEAAVRRFARWRARRDAAIARERETGVARRFGRFSPLKPGRPPGWRRKPTHEVHEVLDVLHGLAFEALHRPDTS